MEALIKQLDESAKRDLASIQRGYDPDEPRDERGRWTTDGSSTTHESTQSDPLSYSETNAEAVKNPAEKPKPKPKGKPKTSGSKKPSRLNAQRYGTARTKPDFEAQTKAYVSDDWLDRIGQIESGFNPDKDQEELKITSSNWHNINSDNGALGLYQFTHIALIDSGIKSESGWDTPLAEAYGIHSDEDFLDSPAAQNAAMGQFARRQESHVDSFDADYGGDIYYDVDGNPIKVTSGGLLGALHKEGQEWVKSYFAEYGTDISLGMTVAPPKGHFSNVQNRMRWLQDDKYQ